MSVTQECKIICSSDANFRLWQQVITANQHGDLVDVDSPEVPLKLMKHRKGWKADMGFLHQEFFKFFGNLSEDDLARFCRHVLNQSNPGRRYAHPKVVLRAFATVLPSCYHYKEWTERKKRKMIARCELQAIDPSLKIISADKEYL